MNTVGCVKAASRILGDKWTPQLLRYFANNETARFCAIEDEVEGINPRTLSARLDSLEHEAIIEKVAADGNNRPCYQLTQKGKDLIPVLEHMHAWGELYKIA